MLMLRKKFVIFSNKTFPTDTIITNLGNCIWEIQFIHKNT